MIRFEVLERLGAAVAAISDKADGDCRNAPGASQSAARERFCQACGVDLRSLVCAEQIHGVTVVRVSTQDRGRGAMDGENAVPGADALITNLPMLPLAITVADCVPLYLFDVQRRAIGLLHAGRRGIFANITCRAVEALEREFECAPARIHALIGPSACPCCYEVSVEIADEWRRAGLPAQGRHLDLWAAAAQQLHAVGVPEGQIHTTGICTISDERFFSHRRDADGRRNLALLVL